MGKLKNMFISQSLGKKHMRRNHLRLQDVAQDMQESLRNYSRYNDHLVQLTDVSDEVATCVASAGVNSSTSFQRDIAAWALRPYRSFTRG